MKKKNQNIPYAKLFFFFMIGPKATAIYSEGFFWCQYDQKKVYHYLKGLQQEKMQLHKKGGVSR